MARIFLLKGDIANPGYVDIPDEATTIREVIYGIGGGIPNGKKFKAVQIGGPSGGCGSCGCGGRIFPVTFKIVFGRRGEKACNYISEDMRRASLPMCRKN